MCREILVELDGCIKFEMRLPRAIALIRIAAGSRLLIINVLAQVIIDRPRLVVALRLEHGHSAIDTTDGQDVELGVSSSAEAAQGAADGQVGRRQIVDALDSIQQLRGQGRPPTGSYHRCRTQQHPLHGQPHAQPMGLWRVRC